MAEARLVSGTPNRYQFIAPRDLVGGDVVLFSQFTAINTANPTVASGDLFGADIGGGIYEMVADEAIAIGQPVYMDETTRGLTEIATDTYMGKSVTATTGAAQLIRFLHMQAQLAV